MKFTIWTFAANRLQPSIHNREDELQNIDNKIAELPENKDIYVNDLYFSYDGADRNYALSGIYLHIPQNKITAIVGASGSGKTTLIKQRLKKATQTANIHDYIVSLPLKYNTKIGMDGSGTSQGQKQRLLIARSVYKNPDFLFFDEATNALDASNERVILDNLNEFYKGKTVVIVAHRLSTVQNADKIVVLDNGKVAEEGTHTELTAKRGLYYELVKNQLELGG